MCSVQSHQISSDIYTDLPTYIINKLAERVFSSFVQNFEFVEGGGKWLNERNLLSPHLVYHSKDYNSRKWPL